MDEKNPCHFFHAEIDDMYAGSLKVENPAPQVVELKLESLDILKDGQPHKIVLREMPTSEYITVSQTK